jgi:hypothetical protein
VDPDPAFQVNPDPVVLMANNLKKTQMEKKISSLINNCNLLIASGGDPDP